MNENPLDNALDEISNKIAFLDKKFETQYGRPDGQIFALEKTAIALSGIEEIGKFCTKIDVYTKNVFGKITSIEALI